MTVRQLDVIFGDVILDVNDELVRKSTLSRSKTEIKTTEPSFHLKEASQEVVDTASQGHFLANAPEKVSPHHLEFFLKLMSICGHSFYLSVLPLYNLGLLTGLGQIIKMVPPSH